MNRTGTFITELRKEYGWTQEDLAERLGVTDKAVSRWETGKGYPEVTLLPKLAEHLGITVSELLAGEHIPEEKQRKYAEEVLIKNLKRSNEKMLKGAGITFLAAVLSVVLNLKLMWSWGYASDAFHGFWSVMEEANFGSFSRILLMLVPLITFGAACYIINSSDYSEK